MNNVNKKYDVGTLSLAEPYFHFIHNLPLLSFGDVMSSVDLSLVLNSKNKTENNFNITNGFKLNLQKRLIINTQNGGSTQISLEDENGMNHYCKYVDDFVYVVHDYGKSVLRKDLIGGKIKYILEYANMSKEIFDSDGNIESLVDKYNNVLLTYNYDENFTLKSIVYRSDKKINLEYTNEKLTAIKYFVKNTDVCTITITCNNLGVIVRHYSGTDFHIETAANPFVAYSTERNTTMVLSDCIENTYAVEPFFDTQGNHQFICSDNGSATLSTQTDLKTNETTYFAYENNLLSKAVTKQGENTIRTGTFLYDSANRQTKDVCSYVFNGTNKSRAINISYATSVGKWDADERIGNYSYKIGEQERAKEIISYDAMKRPKTFTKNIENIAYKKELVYNCGMVRSVTDTKNVGGVESDLGTVEYAYDASRRIVRATNVADGTSISYEYDSIGRLVRENNAQLNRTYVYQYDALGNVVSKKTYAFTENTLPASALSQMNFTYSSTDPDRLTSFGNKSISYDYQGCPISYSDKKYTWSSGKLLQIAIGDINVGRETFSYTYNGNGLRTKKVYSYMPPRRGTVPAYYIANKTTSYFYDHSGRLLEEHSTTTNNNGSSETSDLVYFYDACGIAGFVHNGSTYYLHRNLHGDVESIFDSTGTLIASYRYDAWGNHKVYSATGAENTSSIFIGNVNPIRYRGYYFDVETNMYFCNARCYVPEWCRWLSQDSVNYIDSDSADGLNLFAYCNNNPVMYVDPSGHSAVVIGILIGVVVGLILGLGYAVHKDRADNGEIDGSVGFKTYAGYGLLFAIMGGIIGAGIGYIWPAISAFVSSSFTIGGGLSVSGAVGATSGGIVITGGQILAGVSAAALTGNIVFSEWKRGTWPGDDPTISPGDGFEWRGPGDVGSPFGEWYNSVTKDQLHPDLKHKPPKGAHWGWRNKLEKFIRDIFK